MSNSAENLPNDPAELRAMIAALQAENTRIAAENANISATLRVHDQLIQALRLRIAKLQKLAFGKSSEKVEREIPLVTLHSQCTAGQWSSWNWRLKICWLPWPKTMTRPSMKG